MRVSSLPLPHHGRKGGKAAVERALAALTPRGEDGSVHPDIRYARNGDVSLAYQVVGDGPRDLLVVSGYLSNIEYAWMYPSLASFLSRLASSSRLILMDRRGSGLSDRFEEAPPVETALRDIEVILDEVGSPRTTLFGLWDGTESSILFAATHPDRVSSLILFTVSRLRSRLRTTRGPGTRRTGTSGWRASGADGGHERGS